jgi:phosphatidylinositol alpha-mannosyltransferase
LASAGVRTEIVAGGPQRGRHEVDGVRYETVRGRDLRRLARDLDVDVTIVPAMAARLRAIAPDVVHSFLYTDALAARLARRPYLVSYGGIALRSSMRGHVLRARMFASATRGARAVVCPSEAAAAHLLNEFGFHAQVIPNGLDVSRFAVDVERDGTRILCAATPNDRRKRPEILVDALGVLVARGLDVEVAFAGDVDESRKAELAARLPDAARSRLRFLGQLDEAGVAKAYASAAVSCLPSLNEAFGMVVVESLAAGTPVGGTRHGANPELLTPEVGPTVPADEVLGCADALEEMLSISGSSTTSVACRARAQRYDWAEIGPKYLDLYERIA